LSRWLSYQIFPNFMYIICTYVFVRIFLTNMCIFLPICEKLNSTKFYNYLLVSFSLFYKYPSNNLTTNVGKKLKDIA
jgi:hypothetical protein